MAKLGPSGEHLWSERFGGPGSNTYLSRIAADGHGGAFLTGTFGGSLDLGGGAPGPAGSTSAPDVVVLDAMFVARIDADGHRVFDRAFGHGLLLPVGMRGGRCSQGRWWGTPISGQATSPGARRARCSSPGSRAGRGPDR